MKVKLILLILILNYVKSKDDCNCFEDETCCQMEDGDYGCCPFKDAICCPDLLTCCPNYSACNNDEHTCDVDNLHLSFLYNNYKRTKISNNNNQSDKLEQMSTIKAFFNIIKNKALKIKEMISNFIN